jgi:hypothetical protein
MWVRVLLEIETTEQRLLPTRGCIFDALTIREPHGERDPDLKPDSEEYVRLWLRVFNDALWSVAPAPG